MSLIFLFQPSFAAPFLRHESSRVLFEWRKMGATLSQDSLKEAVGNLGVETATAEVTCRICYEEGTLSDPLLSPCRCKGSMGFVHNSCLTKWVQSWDLKRCEVCQENYLVKVLFRRPSPIALTKDVFFKVFLDRDCRSPLSFWLLTTCLWVILLWIMSMSKYWAMRNDFIAQATMGPLESFHSFMLLLALLNLWWCPTNDPITFRRTVFCVVGGLLALPFFGRFDEDNVNCLHSKIWCTSVASGLLSLFSVIPVLVGMLIPILGMHFLEKRFLNYPTSRTAEV